ncbi:30S ribosomal protein S2, partial [Candidatus Parcubacteria bacterium]|nr:30S ribosomal protein S2 [Candidatus Parcubacteria bacterium]
MEEKIQNPYNLSVEEMAKAGVHLGHSPSKTHPKMKPFIFGLRNHIHIIDLEKAIPKFEEALKFLEN